MNKKTEDIVIPHLAEAYKTSWRVLREKKTTWQAVIDACDSLPKQFRAQQHNRNENSSNPTKLLFNSDELFQFNLFKVLEKAEIAHEKAEFEKGVPISELLLIRRFIKRIIVSCWNRRPFHLTVGLAGLLYEADLAQIIDIHDCVIQDFDLSKDQSERNASLRTIKSDLLNRFDGRLDHAVDGNRRVKFNNKRASQEIFDSVRNDLSLFVPWSAKAHVIPRGHVFTRSDTRTEGFLKLPPFGKPAPNQSRKEFEMSVWRKRIHILIEPDCFDLIAKALGLMPLINRLQIPRFIQSQHDDSDPTVIDVQEIPPPDFYKELYQESRRRHQRRRNMPACTLSVLVDGQETEYSIAIGGGPVHMRIPSDAKEIVLNAEDKNGVFSVGELSLELYRDFIFEEISSAFYLEGENGMEINLTVRAPENETGGLGYYAIDMVCYKHSAWAKAKAAMAQIVQNGRRTLGLVGSTTGLIAIRDSVIGGKAGREGIGESSPVRFAKPSIFRPAIVLVSITLMALALAIFFAFPAYKNADNAEIITPADPIPENILTNNADTHVQLPDQYLVLNDSKSPERIDRFYGGVVRGNPEESIQEIAELMPPIRSGSSRISVDVKKPFLRIRIRLRDGSTSGSLSATLFQEDTAAAVWADKQKSVRRNGRLVVMYELPTKDLRTGNYTLRIKGVGKKTSKEGDYTYFLSITK